MGYLYRPMLKRGAVEGGRRCANELHGRGAVCPGCGAAFNGIWWAKYYVNGKMIRRSTETAKETEAKKKLKEWEGHPEAHPQAMDRLTFDDLAADLLTDYQVNGRRSTERIETASAHLRAFFTGWRAVHITPTAVRKYIARRQEEKAANGTVNRELAALKRMFVLALQAEKLTRRPYIPMLEERNVRTGFFSELDYLALRDALPEPLRAPADLAYTFGWRKQEVLGLTWDRVDLLAGTVRLDPGTTKNAEGRTVVLTEELKATLTRLRQQTPKECPWVFHRKGRRIKDFRKAWDTARTDAKLPPRLFHDFRRTAVRNMERASVPRSVAMQITGHKTESIYRRYAIVDEGAMREAAAKLTGTAAGTAGPADGENANVMA